MEEEWNHLKSRELQSLFRRHFIRGIFFLALLIVLIFALALSFEPQINQASEWVTKNFGLPGMMAVIYLADTMISPFPPDTILLVISKSAMHEKWFFYVPILGFVSTLAGLTGWLIGQKIHHLPMLRRLIDDFAKEHEGTIRRFGFWMVVLGSLTPLPFSITCWVAGVFQLPFERMILATLLRVPRFVLYYWVIFFSGEFGAFLRNLL